MNEFSGTPAVISQHSEGKEESVIIFHVDVNSAFLSWSAIKQLKENPGSVDLRTIPSAVGGDVKTRHGIITAKSIPAKKYGIVTGEPVVKALKKCPMLTLVPSDFQTYRRYSHSFIEILKTYTDKVEQVSIDEAYMDVTGLFRMDQVLSLAVQIKNEIRDTLGFTVNVGISVNKLLAKTASDFSKPDKIHTLWPSEIPAKFWPMDIDELHGCGAATARKLHGIGLHTIGDVAHTDLSILQSLLGEKAGTYLHNSTNGRGSTHVHADSPQAKGYSNESTTPVDINLENYDKEALPLLDHLSEKVARRLQKDNVYASTIGVMVKTDQFQRHSRQRALSASTNQADRIRSIARELLEDLVSGNDGLFSRGIQLRLLGVSATSLDHGEFRQMSLEDLLSPAADSGKAAVSAGRTVRNSEKPAPADQAVSHPAKPKPADQATSHSQALPSAEQAVSSQTSQLPGKAKAAPAVLPDDKRKQLEEMMVKIQAAHGKDALHKGIERLTK